MRPGGALLRVVSAVLLASLIPFAAARGAPTPDRPNVLFVVIDDLNDWVGYLGGNPQAPWDRPAVTTYRLGNHAVRSERWRYIRYAGPCPLPAGREHAVAGCCRRSSAAGPGALRTPWS